VNTTNRFSIFAMLFMLAFGAGSCKKERQYLSEENSNYWLYAFNAVNDAYLIGGKYLEFRCGEWFIDSLNQTESVVFSVSSSCTERDAKFRMGSLNIRQSDNKDTLYIRMNRFENRNAREQGYHLQGELKVYQNQNQPVLEGFVDALRKDSDTRIFRASFNLVITWQPGMLTEVVYLCEGSQDLFLDAGNSYYKGLIIAGFNRSLSRSSCMEFRAGQAVITRKKESYTIIDMGHGLCSRNYNLMQHNQTRLISIP
jgi:hypothetical protein